MSRAETTLGELDELWRTLAEHSPDHIMLLDPLGHILYINRTVPDLSPDRVLGRDHLEFLPPAPRAASRAALLRVVERRAPTTFQTEYHTATGEVRHFDVRLGPVLQGGVLKAVISSSTDVTDRVRVAEALRQTAEVHRLTFEHSPFGICHFDRHGVVTACNQALARILGAPAERVIGVDMQRAMTNPAQQAALQEALAGRVGHFEGPYRSVTGDRHSFLRTAYIPLLGPDGRPAGGISCVEVLTELREREAQLASAQRLESLGLLAGGLAHDFNNLLTPVLLSTELMVQRSAGTSAEPALVAIRKAVERAGLLTNQLLAFSRHQVLDLERVELGAQLLACQPLLRRLLREDIELDLDLDPGDDAWIMADTARLEQALLNLAANAQEAMPRGGTLHLALRHDPTVASRQPGGSASPLGWSILTVSDTGCGMDEATVARVFEPFFSSKQRSRGTGLGLATVHGIVRQHGGWIEVHSAPGQGASFVIGLPALAAPQPSPSAPPRPQPVFRGGSETILVVEDDPDVRLLTTEILEGLGYQVMNAGGAREALGRLASFTGDIHLLVSDVVMPGMSGPVLFETLASTRPSLKVLFISGYADGLTPPPPPHRYHFLPKPYDVSGLARTVREALDARGP
ncbi:MAG: PAS domain-containing protein [Deltaproteobacteria bacterium]|nr:PAS domain-containing protein [Deltaproteobacteria bacterium]